MDLGNRDCDEIEIAILGGRGRFDHEIGVLNEIYKYSDSAFVSLDWYGSGMNHVKVLCGEMVLTNWSWI